MLLLIVGLVIFFAIHLVPAQSEIRNGMVERFGEGPYKIAFSIVSAVGLALIVYGYGKLQAAPGKNPDLWFPPAWTRHVAFTLMLPAIILLVAAYIPSNIRTAARHPMLAAIKLWALAHLLANGDLASVILFGSFLAWAIYDRISLKHREAFGPLGKAKGSLVGDLAVIVVGLGVYAAILFRLHEWVIGVPLVSSPV